MFRPSKTIKPAFISFLVLAILFLDFPFGIFGIIFQAWKDNNVVDVMWQAMKDGSVADSFRPKTAEAAPIAQYSGGLLVYADGTAGTPKYKTFDDSAGFGSEQSASSVGSVAIEWIRVIASPTNDEWIIATRDADDDIDAQVCTGVDGGISCGSPTNITTTAGTHGFRNYDVAYEQSSGDALLVYGTATADELRKIVWTSGSWGSDAAITTTRTSGTVEWVELTSRPGSDQIGIAYSDSADDVSAYRWNGSSAADEATAAITTAASTGNLRKFDVSFEGLSGEMVVYGSANGGGTAYEGRLQGTTWTITSRTGLDMTTDFIDLQEPGATNAVAAFAHGDAASSNPSEGWVYEGDDTITDGTAGDDIVQNWAANHQLGAVSEFSSGTYRAVAVISSVTGAGADDIDWWTTNSSFGITNRTVNARTRGAAYLIDLFDYPNADKVLLLTADANSDLWADTWAGAAVDGTAWTDLTSGGTLEDSLVSVTTDVVDFAFKLAPPPTAALSGTVTETIDEADIVAGLKTVVLTLSGDNWVADGATFEAQRQNIINGLDSAQSEAAGWDAVVKAGQGVSGVVRTSATVVTITLDDFASYNITAQETITATIPATALVGGGAVVATPTFTIDVAVSISITRTDSEGTISYGIVDTSGSTSTDPAGQNKTTTFQNNGTAAEKFSIKTENSTNWTAINTDPSAQTNQFRHSFATTSPVTYWKPMGIHPTYAVASSSVAANGSLNVYLKIETPGTDTSNYAQQSVTVTVFAEQAEAAACGGAEWGGYCWYEGASNTNCTDTCASHGGNAGTCQENDNTTCDLCKTVFSFSAYACGLWNDSSAPSVANPIETCHYRIIASGDCSTTPGVNAFRFCACNE